MRADFVAVVVGGSSIIMRQKQCLLFQKTLIHFVVPVDVDSICERLLRQIVIHFPRVLTHGSDVPAAAVN
jgi:hypothetical protein